MSRLVDALTVSATSGGGEGDGDAAAGGERRTYFPFDPARLRDGEYLDPWGHPYVFVAPPPGQPQGFLLYSRGENGVDEGGVRGDDVGLLVINVAGAVRESPPGEEQQAPPAEPQGEPAEPGEEEGAEREE